jgi:hypothetical protein
VSIESRRWEARVPSHLARFYGGELADVREDKAYPADVEAVNAALRQFRFPGGTSVGFGGGHADELARSLLSAIFKAESDTEQGA